MTWTIEEVALWIAFAAAHLLMAIVGATRKAKTMPDEFED